MKKMLTIAMLSAHFLSCTQSAIKQQTIHEYIQPTDGTPADSFQHLIDSLFRFDSIGKAQYLRSRWDSIKVADTPRLFEIRLADPSSESRDDAPAIQSAIDSLHSMSSNDER